MELQKTVNQTIQSYQDKFLEESLTFDDVLLIPRYSDCLLYTSDAADE